MTLTVAGTSVFEDEPTKGSRFVALVAPASTPEAAEVHVAAAAARWPDATHHAWAWRLRDGTFRAHDAGEPAGSAGRPILARIDGRQLTDVVVVVARWFGGTKLGVGGLIRAYGGCAGRALDRSSVAEVVPLARLEITHGYDDVGAVQGVVASRGLVVVDTRWEEEVHRVVEVVEAEREAVCAELADRTSGRARVR